MTIDIADFDSPVGQIRIATLDGRLCALGFTDRWDDTRRVLERRFGASFSLRFRNNPGGIATALREYFDGDLEALDLIETDVGGTPFQQQVWEALRKVRPGCTVSYGELARAIGRPGAARAVGHANSQNPIALVVPCHRVIGADKQLVGYAGGLNRKEWLLRHEGAV